MGLMKNAKYLKTLKEIKTLLIDDAECHVAVDLLIAKLKASESKLSNWGQAFPLPPELKKTDKSFFLYSDGACRGNPGPGAWGVMVQDYKGEVIFENANIKNPTTNNQMELEGAIQALNYLLGLELDPSSMIIHLFSDSKYVVDGLKSWMDGWKRRGWKKADKKVPENIDYWKKIDSLRSQFININYYWVKGHAGHPQNERCDQLANQVLDENGY